MPFITTFQRYLVIYWLTFTIKIAKCRKKLNFYFHLQCFSMRNVWKWYKQEFFIIIQKIITEFVEMQLKYFCLLAIYRYKQQMFLEKTFIEVVYQKFLSFKKRNILIYSKTIKKFKKNPRSVKLSEFVLTHVCQVSDK